MQQKFNVYSESYLHTKGHFLHFIREQKRKQTQLAGRILPTDIYKKLNALQDLDEVIEEINVYKICYKTINAVCMWSNSYIVCETCIKRIVKCSYCDTELSYFSRTKVIGDIISENPQTT